MADKKDEDKPGAEFESRTERLCREAEIEFRDAMRDVAWANDLPLDLFDWYERTTAELGKARLREHPDEVIDPRQLARRSFEGFKMVMPAWIFLPTAPGVH
jgi:hypothetical protein